MTPSLQSRLKDSWAEIFRGEVLTVLLRSEEDFAALYGVTGRPNFSVARILGLCFLQELSGLSDQEALDAFGFDARWQYALDVTEEEAYLSRRSLVEFRSRLVRADPEMTLMRGLFDLIAKTAIDRMGISFSEQRGDSTHIQSNIHTKGRLALFMDVIGTLQSAYDPDASYGHKGQGYSVHVTETCNNPDTPEIITDYEVHGAARSDVGKAPDMLDRLKKADRSPEKLFVDGGYPTVESAYDIIKRRGIELKAPVHRGPMDPAVMGRDRFEFGDDGHVVSCPEGHPAIDHKILSNNSTARTLHAVFDGDICRQCPKLETCPVRAPNHRKKGESPRETSGNFRLEITPELRLRDDMLQEQQTPEWKDDYKIRSGIEATMSELKRGYGLAKLRVRGLSRVHFAVVCKLVACNIKRWWRATRAAGSGDTPRSTEPTSPPETIWPRWCSIRRGRASRKIPFPDITFNAFIIAA
jgi:hypothetical protein